MPTLYRTSTGDTAWGTLGNWKTIAGVNGTPASGDTLIIGAGATSILSTLDQSALINITLIITQAFTGVIGTVVGSVATYLQIGAISLTIGENPNTAIAPGGSPLLLIDVGASANTTRIQNSSPTSSDDAYPAIQLKGSDITMHVSGGNVAVAPRIGETATLKQLNVSYLNTGTIPNVYLGPGVTITAVTGKINIAAGAVTNTSEITATAIAAVNCSNGDYLYRGTAAHTAIIVGAESYCEYSGTGTCTLASVHGEIDGSKDQRAKTITTIEAYKGAVVNLDNGVAASITHNLKWIDTDPGHVRYSLPDNMQASPTAI